MADSSVTAFAFSRHVSEIHGYPPTELDLNLGSNFSANCRLVSAVSWLENLRGMESHVVSAFPHVLILIVLPVCLFGVLWLVYRTSDTCSRRDVRRAGMVMVMSGAFVFSISHMIAGIIHFVSLRITMGLSLRDGGITAIEKRDW